MPIQNPMKQALKDGKHVFGTWSMLSSPIVLNVIATSGLDFVIIDLEHGPTTFETAENQLFAAEAGGIQPIIRLSDGSAHSILHALEIGANSILVSQVSTAEQAKEIVQSCLYFPDGNRGLSPFTRTHGFSDEGLAEKLVAANQTMFVGVLVEGEEGISNLPEIVQVDGIDMVYIGVYDLSQACGVPGDLEHPRVLDIMQKCVKTIEDAGLVAGSVARNQKYMALLLEAGFRFISYRVDAAILKDGFENVLEKFNSLRSNTE